MLSRMKQMIVKEFIQVLRDKRTRFVLIIPPIVQMLVFGYAANFEVHHVPTIVLDFDHSQESRDLLSHFSASSYFDVEQPATNRAQFHDAIEQGRAAVGIEVDAGFAQALRKGQPAPVQVVSPSARRPQTGRPPRLLLWCSSGHPCPTGEWGTYRLFT